MVYAYAIADSPRPDVAGQHGLAYAPLDVRLVGRLAAIFTVHEGPAPKPTAENVWRHEQVVERIMADHAVLPARFGTTFSDPAKLETVLARHQDRLAEGLGRVRGCVELGLRVLWQPRAGAADKIPAESGRAYMTARLAEEQRRREELCRAELVAEEMHVPLAGIASENTRHVLARPEVPLTA